MSEPVYLEVDPSTLHLPPSRASGADPVKLQRQLALYGTAIDGMPPLWVYRGSDGALMIYDGVTRATRVALLLPGTRVRVEVIGDLTAPCGHLPTVGAPSP
jgi:hypothetical protein